MSLVNFYKGPESEYLEETHGGGIYQCTDSENTYIFGVKNKSSETEIINLAFTSLPDNGSQHTIDQSNFNKLASALDNNKVIYVRTACNLFVVHSIYDVSMYSGANRSTVFLYFHFNVGSMDSSSITLEDITRDVNGYITIDMSQTPNESNKYTYTVYTTSPYYVLDKITPITFSELISYTNSPINLENTYTRDEINGILLAAKNNNTKLVLTTSENISIIFNRVAEVSITSDNTTLNYTTFSSEALVILVGYANISVKLIIVEQDDNYQLISMTTDYSELVNTSEFSSFKTDVTNKFKNYLSTSNTMSYTPTSNYNPATKKYVDDSINAQSIFRIIVDDLPTNSFNDEDFQKITIRNVEGIVNELRKDKEHIFVMRDYTIFYGWLSLININYSGTGVGNVYSRVSEIKLSFLLRQDFNSINFNNEKDTYLVSINIRSSDGNEDILTSGYTTTVNYKIL